jgi:hypothetical protein
MSQNPTASIVILTMPAHNHSTAPKFKSDQPHKLHRYFNKLAHLFGNCQIMDTQDKKKYAIWYLEIDSADLWETLLEFHTTSTYEECVLAVLAFIPWC